MNTRKRPVIAASLPSYTMGEEIANSILHGIGTLLAIIGLVLLSLNTGGFLSRPRAETLDIIGVIIFASTMIGMYLMSTLYHAIQHRSAKGLLRKLDHSVIFVFIAGTYTPLCLSGLGGAWGWSLFGFQWALASLGVIFSILDSRAFKKVKMAVYLMMGWAIIVGFVPLIRSVPVHSIALLFAGGAAYTLGILWYRNKSLRFNHFIWHVFVLIGTICHWFSIWYLN